jgi:hypothetical protein
MQSVVMPDRILIRPLAGERLKLRYLALILSTGAIGAAKE